MHIHVRGCAVLLAVSAVSLASAVPANATPIPNPLPIIDSQAPTAPTGLTTSGITQSAISLAWSASSDNIDVAGYDVARNGTQVASQTSRSYTHTGLACGTTYLLGVSAYDVAGNVSPTATKSATTAACSGGGGTPPPPPTGSTAQLWVDTDGGSCSRSATAADYADGASCGSFGSAFSKAQPGDTVLVRCKTGASCTFAPETLSGDRGSSARVTFAAAPGYTVAFEGTPGNGRYTWIDELKNVTFKNIGFGRSTLGDSTPNLRMDCARNVTLVNATGRRFFMFEGNVGITFQGGDWGSYKDPGEEDSTMGTTGAYGPANTCSGDAAPRPSGNVVFDGVTWRDVFWTSSCSVINGGQCSEWGAAHPDCFEINGYVDGVIIRNSTFSHCRNTMLSLYTDQGDIKNVTVENNTFRDMSPYSYYGIQWVTTSNFKCDNDRFVDNTYTPNSPNAWLANTPPRFACKTSSATPGTQVTDNTIQQAPPSQECSSSKAAPYNTVWQRNSFQAGSCS